MEMILLRHGEALGNPERRFVGVTDVPLTSKGEEQANRRSGAIPDVDCVFSSPLQRCLHTADIIWPGRERIVVEGLRETDFGRFEYQCHEELKDDLDYQVWLEGGGNKSLAGTESADACALRIRSALETIIRICIQNAYERVGVVTHGGTIMNMLWKYGVPSREYYDWLVPNCGGWIITANHDPLSLNVIRVLDPI